MEKDHDKTKSTLKRLDEDFKRKEKSFKDAEKEALKYCKGNRLDVTKNSRELYALKKEYEKQKEVFLKSVDGQSYHEVNRRRQRKQHQVEQLEQFIKNLDSNVQQVSQMVQKRKTFFITMRSRSFRAISRAFTLHISQHNLTGQMFSDYKRKKLTLDVQPTNMSNETSVQTSSSHTSNGNTYDSDGLDGSIQPSKFSLTSLSGGERSKTLVCLINALWDVQHPPFRCLDEWDVFLDAIARKNMEGMLVETALRTDKQYFFISPQGSIFSGLSENNTLEKYKNNIKVFTIKK